MYDRKNKLTDKVNVTMHNVPKSRTNKDYSYARVKRNTAYIGNILDKILEVDKNLSRSTLLYATELLRNGITALLKEGKSVDLLELGSLYPKPVASMETSTPSINDVPELTVAFTPSDLAINSVKNVTIGFDVTKSSAPEVTSILDMKTEKEGSAISLGGTVKIIGNKLKVAGNEDSNAGVFFAPCNDRGVFSDDIATWICIPQSSLALGNTSSSLVFNAPEELAAGTYRLIIRTASKNGQNISKAVRQGIFDEIVTVV